MRDIEKTKQAKNDLTELADYLAWRENDELADRFLIAAEDTIQILAEYPGLGVRRDYGRPMLRGLRMRAIAGFPNHLIFYTASDQILVVQRVIHGSRNLEAIFGASTDD